MTKNKKHFLICDMEEEELEKWEEYQVIWEDNNEEQSFCFDSEEEAKNWAESLWDRGVRKIKIDIINYYD